MKELYQTFKIYIKDSLSWITTSIFKLYAHLFAKIKGVDLLLGKIKLVGFPIFSFASGSKIKIGDKTVLVSTKYSNPIGLTKRTNIRILKKNAELIIGNNVGISGCTICCTKKISIGNDVIIGANCIIIDTDFHDYFNKITREFEDPELIPEEEVIISDNVKLAMNVTILKGVHIGTGSVIASNTTVTKSFPSYSLVAGNPGRLIRSLGD